MAKIGRATAHQLHLLGLLYDGLPLPEAECATHVGPLGERACLRAVVERGLLREDGLALTDDGRATVEHRRRQQAKERQRQTDPRVAPAARNVQPERPDWQAAMEVQRRRAARRREDEDRKRRARDAEVARIEAGGDPIRCKRHGKLCWPTAETAHAARVASLRTGRYDPGLEVYRCDRGDWWHLGHPGGWKSLQRRMEAV